MKKTSRVFTSLHGPITWYGVPREISAVLLLVVIFDILAAHTFYTAGAACVIWLILLLVFRHDSIYFAVMLRRQFRRLYK